MVKNSEPDGEIRNPTKFGASRLGYFGRGRVTRSFSGILSGWGSGQGIPTQARYILNKIIYITYKNINRFTGLGFHFFTLTPTKS